MIRLEELSKQFGSVRAVDSLTFEVERGELFGLVGPDGAGKTTTLRMLAGVLRPSSGMAILDGLSIVDEPEAVKHHLAYMSQRFGLYTDLTVLENLHFYADLYRVPKGDRDQRLGRLFEFSGLEPFRDRLAGNLSGGMKQKLGLSCALIHEPRILLLDEPTFGVDPISRRDLWIIIHEMVARGVTAIVSTSYMDEAERFDRIAFIDGGRLLAVDAPDRLRASVEGEILSVVAGDVRKSRDAARRLPWVRRAVVFGDRLHVTTDSASARADELRAALASEDLVVSSIARIDPSMEDVFVDRIDREQVP